MTAVKERPCAMTHCLSLTVVGEFCIFHTEHPETRKKRKPKPRPSRVRKSG